MVRECDRAGSLQGGRCEHGDGQRAALDAEDRQEWRGKLPPGDGHRLDVLFDQSRTSSSSSVATSVRNAAAPRRRFWPSSSSFSFCATSRSTLIIATSIPLSVDRRRSCVMYRHRHLAQHHVARWADAGHRHARRQLDRRARGHLPPSAASRARSGACRGLRYQWTSVRRWSPRRSPPLPCSSRSSSSRAIAGQLFRDQALTVTISLLASLRGGGDR